MRMCVTDAYDGMSSIEVKVLLTFIVPHATTFAADDVNIEQWIYIK